MSLMFARFVEWLEDQPVGSIVGDPHTAEDCPVCRWLNEAEPGVEHRVYFEFATGINPYLDDVWLPDDLNLVQYHFLELLADLPYEADTFTITREQALDCCYTVRRLGWSE